MHISCPTPFLKCVLTLKIIAIEKYEVPIVKHEIKQNFVMIRTYHIATKTFFFPNNISQ